MRKAVVLMKEMLNEEAFGEMLFHSFSGNNHCTVIRAMYNHEVGKTIPVLVHTNTHL